LTLITDHWAHTMARLQHYCKLRRSHPEIEAAVTGFHLEGPFLSPEPGYCGAHDANKMIAATPAHLAEARAIAGTVPLLLTVAPECPGVDQLVESAFSDPATFVNSGHTNASSEKLLVRSQGYPAMTHLGNGCPQLLDRHDNIIWRALNLDPLWVSLIPDGRHVSADLFRIIHRIKGDRIYYTTDAMSAAGAPIPGRYRLGALDLEVKEDGIVRFPGGTQFAGSALTPIAGVFRAAAMLNSDWQHSWKFFSDTPARRINAESSMAPGMPADFCLLEFAGPPEEPGAGHALRLRTWASGAEHETTELVDPAAIGIY
jgi:N-acetylglucosamine-6-phosphate deacetylase